MTPYRNPASYTHGDDQPIGVLLTNLGTPEAPTPQALRRYLGQFLWDPRIIEPPPARWLWWLILNGPVLLRRPARSARLYANIWTPEGSPLLRFTRLQAAGIASRLAGRLPETPLRVAVGMRYGSPSIAAALDELAANNCNRVVVLPLFPQYSATTTGATWDAVADALKRIRRVPDLRFVSCYHDDPAYIAALAASARELWDRDGEPDRLLISFHGIPRRYFLNGDLYHCHCHKTARLLAEALGLSRERYTVGFQSQFGKEPWLQPYTEDLIKLWARERVPKVDAICPGFSSDCLETLEEMNITNREIWDHEGGLQYRYIPALNDRADHIELLTGVVERNLAGWLSPLDTDSNARERANRCMRAAHEQVAATSPNTTMTEAPRP